MDIEKQSKQFLNEIYNRYNNLTDEDYELKCAMKNEIYNFLYDFLCGNKLFTSV